jgi:hypothetical protein
VRAVHVDDLIEECGLGEHRELVRAALREGYRLAPDERGPHRVGGLPDLADGEAWPEDENGVAYTLAAQIDCLALPPLPGAFPGPDWGHGGRLLRIFALLEDQAPEPGPARALACSPRESVTRTAREAMTLQETRVQAVPCLTAGVAWYVGIPDDIREEYEEFMRRLGERPALQLLGQAGFIATIRACAVMNRGRCC